MVRGRIYRDDPEIVVGGSGFVLVVIRGVANLLPIGREGIVVLPAEREHGRIVIAGSQVARSVAIGREFIRGSEDGGRAVDFNDAGNWHHENVRSFAFFIGIPMTIEKVSEDL